MAETYRRARPIYAHAVKALIFHGYLLHGTGSNVYNASLARALAGLGHEVHLVCQDRRASDLGAGAEGSVTIHNPDLERFPPFAEEAVEGAAGILVGSSHIADRLRQAVGSLGEDKVRLGPPGVDTDLFARVPENRRGEQLRQLAARLTSLEGKGAGTTGTW